MSTHNPYWNAYRGQRPWTKKDDARLLDMVRSKKRHREIATELGRTITSIRMRLIVVDPDRVARRELTTWTAEQLALAQEHLAKRTGKVLFHRIVGHTIEQAKMKLLRDRAKARMLAKEPPPSAIVVPQDVLIDRKKRQEAPTRDLVGSLMGDPPKGFSALEGRR